jgi:hypothetical protein
VGVALRIFARTLSDLKGEDAKIKLSDGSILQTGYYVFSLPRPNRHHNLFAPLLMAQGWSTIPEHEQGFVDSQGVWLGRRAAFLRAKRNQQLILRKAHQYNGPELFSEDLW